MFKCKNFEITAQLEPEVEETVEESFPGEPEPESPNEDGVRQAIVL